MPPTVNGRFQDGCFSCSFDNQPPGSSIFTRVLGGVGYVTTPTGGNRGVALHTFSGTSGILLGTNLVTLIDGHHFQTDALPASSAIIQQWYDATAATVQCSLRLFNDGHLQFFLGTGTGTALGSASSAGTIVANSMYFLETKVKIDPSTGTVEARIAGSTVASGSSLNTRSSANSWVSAFDFVNNSNSYIDDWYMLDLTGSAPLNDFLGPLQVIGDKPSANSAGTGGAHGNQFNHTNPQNDNHLNAGNAPINTAQFNSDSTPGDYDMFQFPAVTAATVFFVNFWNQSNLDAAGSRTVSIDAYLSASDFVGPAFAPPVTASVGVNNLVCVKDPTGTSWTATTASNVEGGVKVVT